MAGNTGKMTREALAARGPRMVLARVGGGLVIFREWQEPFRTGTIYSVLAKSYTLSYLKRLREGNL